MTLSSNINGIAAFVLHWLLAVMVWSWSSVGAFVVNLSPSSDHSLIRPTKMELEMALTPIGPFCPFRSSLSTQNLDPVDDLAHEVPDFSNAMQQVQRDLYLGNSLDKDRLMTVASGIEQSLESWETLMTRMRLSSDFQTKEYGKFVEANFARFGISPGSISTMMKWQSECLKSLVRNAPPPPFPEDMDLNGMMQQGVADQNLPTVSAASSGIDEITESPFDVESEVFQQPVIRHEYEALCRDHERIIEHGISYAEFGQIEKLTYLDQVDEIQDRWDVFFTRFELMGELDPKFKEQCDGLLSGMCLSEEEYRTLLKEVHGRMRDEARQEQAAIEGFA